MRYAALAAACALWCGPVAADAAAPKREAFDLRADSGTLVESGGEDVLTLTGHVQLTHGSTIITADGGQYMRAARIVLLSGNVVIHDSTTTVASSQATYYRNEQLAILEQRSRLTDKDLTVTGDRVSYDRRLRRATVLGSPRMIDKARTVTADQITYERDRERIVAEGRVHGVDLDEKADAWGDRLDYNRKSKTAVLTGSPRLADVDVSPQGDTTQTLVRALSIALVDSPRVVTAVDSVHITRGRFTGEADSVVLLDAENRAVLTGSPQAWNEDSHVSGDTLDLFFTGRTIDRARVAGAGRLEYEGAPSDTTSTGRRSGKGTEHVTLEGPLLGLTFVDEKVRTVDASPPAAATYRYEEPERPDRTESTTVKGDSIHGEIADNQVQRVTVSGSAEGTYTFFPQNDPAREDHVTYRAPEVVFRVPDDHIDLNGGATVVHGTTTLAAKTVTVNSKTETMAATGPLTLTANGDQITGDALTYDIEHDTGTIEGGRTQFDKGFYSGRLMHRVDENTYAVEGAVYTTCDRLHPHYGFAARQMKIQVGKRIIAKPVVFYLWKIPVFALPFYVIPLQSGRHSGMLFPSMDFGFSQPQGRFFRNLGYFWAPSDYWDLATTLDYAEGLTPEIGSDVTVRLSGRYNVRRVPLGGNATLKYVSGAGGRRTDYTFDAAHTQSLPGGISANGSARFASSVDAYQSIDNSRETRIGSANLYSAMTLTRTWPSFNATLSFDRNQTLAQPGDSTIALPPVPASIVSNRPRASLYVSPRPIGRLGAPGRPARVSWLSTTYYRLSLDYQDVLDTRVGGRSYRRLVTSSSLSDNRKVGWLNVGPQLSLVDTRYDADSTHAFGSGYQQVAASLNASTTFYGYYRGSIGPLAGVRHTFSPRASYTFTPAQHASATPFADGAIGGGAGSQRISVGVDQRLQIKLKHGDTITKLDNLVSTSTQASYNLRTSRFDSDISSNVHIAPIDRLTADISWQNGAPGTIDHWRFKNVVMSLSSNIALQGTWSGISFGGHRDSTHAAAPVRVTGLSDTTGAPPATGRKSGLPWSFALSMGASRLSGDGLPARFQNVFTQGSIDVNVTKGWKLTYGAAFDVDAGELVSQDYTIYRDLHCWEARFTRRYSGRSWEYYFRIGVKSLPEVFYERGSRFIGTPRLPSF